MREFPVFVPWKDVHVAAVVAAPDGPPRGLALLSTGMGASRSHRYQVWAVAAERLAARGIASVRFEYAWVHDSTGSVDRVRAFVAPVEQATTVVRFAQAATGADKVIAVGNCYGANLALALAATMEDCVGALCILPEKVERRGLPAVVRRLAGWKAFRLLRSSRRLRRLVMRSSGRLDTRVRFHGPLPAALERSRVVFLYEQEALEGGPDPFSEIRATTELLSEAQRSRFELQVAQCRGLRKFGSVESQQTVLDALLAMAEQCFAPARESAASRQENSARR